MQSFLVKEFVDYASERFGVTVAERLLANSPLDSRERFSGWKYIHPEELSILADILARETGVSRAELLVDYGRFMFRTLVNLPLLHPPCEDLFAYLESIEGGLCAELDALFPHLEFPGLGCRRLDDNTLEFVYSSRRELGDLAEGLLRASVIHFDEPVLIERFNDPQDPKRVRFLLTRV